MPNAYAASNVPTQQGYRYGKLSQREYRDFSDDVLNAPLPACPHIFFEVLIYARMAVVGPAQRFESGPKNDCNRRIVLKN
jgi:hypothetical protein